MGSMAFCQGACNRKVSQRADRGTGPGAQNPTGISRPHRRWGSGPSNLLGGGGGRDCDDQSASSLQALGRRRPQESDYAADSRPGIWDGLACRLQGQYGRPCGHHHHQAWASRVRPATWCHYDQRPLAHGLGGSRVYAQDMDRYPAQPCRILADTHGSLVRWELLQGPQESYCAGRPPSGRREHRTRTNVWCCPEHPRRRVSIVTTCTCDADVESWDSHHRHGIPGGGRPKHPAAPHTLRTPLLPLSRSKCALFQGCCQGGPSKQGAGVRVTSWLGRTCLLRAAIHRTPMRTHDATPHLEGLGGFSSPMRKGPAGSCRATRARVCRADIEAGHL